MIFYRERKVHKEGRQPVDVTGIFLRGAKKIPVNFLSLSVLSVNSSKLGERVRDIRRSSGFTLIELLVVIVLMAIIIAISAPAFVGLGRGTGMRGAVRSVHSTLSLLRQWAITHREQVTFVYVAATNPTPSYYYATNEFGTAIISTNDPPKLPMDVMFADSSNITFKTDGGLASGAMPVEVIIADRKRYSIDNSQKKTISINGLTGGIKVE